MSIIKKLFFALCLAMILSSCVSVKEYQKMYLNDIDMQLSDKAVEGMEVNFESYREGVSGANSGKSGGGCGCN